MKTILFLGSVLLASQSALAGDIFVAAQTSCEDLTMSIQAEGSITIDGNLYISNPNGCAADEVAVEGCVLSSERWPCYFGGFLCQKR